MNILIVSQYFWPESFRINDVVRTLAGRGLALEVLTGKPNYPEGLIYPNYKTWGCQKESKFGLIVNRVPLFPRGKDAWRLMLNYFSFIASGNVRSFFRVVAN